MPNINEESHDSQITVSKTEAYELLKIRAYKEVKDEVIHSIKTMGWWIVFLVAIGAGTWTYVVFKGATEVNVGQLEKASIEATQKAVKVTDQLNSLSAMIGSLRDESNVLSEQMKNVDIALESRLDLIDTGITDKIKFLNARISGLRTVLDTLSEQSKSIKHALLDYDKEDKNLDDGIKIRRRLLMDNAKYNITVNWLTGEDPEYVSKVTRALSNEGFKFTTRTHVLDWYGGYMRWPEFQENLEQFRKSTSPGFFSNLIKMLPPITYNLTDMPSAIISSEDASGKAVEVRQLLNDIKVFGKSDNYKLGNDSSLSKSVHVIQLFLISDVRRQRIELERIGRQAVPQNSGVDAQQPYY